MPGVAFWIMREFPERGLLKRFAKYKFLVPARTHGSASKVNFGQQVS